MEALMHFVWEHGLAGDSLVATAGAKSISVIDPGRHNLDAGPDFFNAKVVIDGRLWAGDVEIHYRAGDWYRHHHDADPAYSSVILHVVAVDDARVSRPDGQSIPQAVLCCNPNFRRDYNSLLSTGLRELPCRRYLPSIHSLQITSWMAAMGFERLQQKSDRIIDHLTASNGDWQQAAYLTMARALGFGLNSDPMTRLAAATPLNLLHKHADNVDALEALLLGQAGFLAGADPEVPYIALMQREYRFYRNKFGLAPIENAGWRVSRTRPGNHPQRRIAMLAAMVCGNFNFVADLLEAGDDLDAVSDLFLLKLSPYWATHYSLDHFPRPLPDGTLPLLPLLGRQAIATLVINVAAPLLMAYGRTHNDSALTDRAVALLERLPAESNRIVNTFVGAGIPCPDAFTSQAMIRLNEAYCSRRDCLHCRLGNRILQRSAVLRPTTVSPI